MKRSAYLSLAGYLCLSAMAFGAPAGQQDSAPGVPTSITVTLEPKRNKTMPAVEQADLSVKQDRDTRPITGFASAAQADTQFMLLIDDSARGTFDTEIGTLKQFINALPPNFEVAIGYMRNGMTDVTAKFTRDHAAAANGIRVALGPGGADVSPYDSLSDAIKKWPQPAAPRREVLMISSGIEGLGGGLYPDNPYVNAGINDAIRAGVVVYTIYSPSVGHFGHSMWRTTWGQNFLSQLSDETGGESFYLGFGSPVSFQPYLDQILALQKNMYTLTFLARPEKKSGFQPVRVMIENKDASIAAPDKVYVKASL
jgi:hypothetical protein